MKKHNIQANENLSKIEIDALVEVTKQMAKVINRKEFTQIVNVYYDASKRLNKGDV